jgi:nitroreductase/NAD-dependent dihydropyrimidine dehydrogenase PreA subunit
MLPHITFSAETCSACGLCAEVCPNKVLLKVDGRMEVIPERVDLCFTCGQCMCICPTRSIQIMNLSYDRDFIDITGQADNKDSFYQLIRTRRAIRNFKDVPVPAELLEKIVDAISMAPMGFPPVKTEIIVVSDPQMIRSSLPQMVDLYDWLYRVFQTPIPRFFIRREVGPQKFRQMESHLIPLLKVRLPGLKKGTEDTITRGAPAMILFHGNQNGEDLREDIYIAATYCMLAAHSLGLGGSIMDLIPPAINKVHQLRSHYGLPDNHEVIAAVIIGFPKYKYQRSIQRQLKSVNWL